MKSTIINNTHKGSVTFGHRGDEEKDLMMEELSMKKRSAPAYNGNN
jgi:hypothetical protein